MIRRGGGGPPTRKGLAVIQGQSLGMDPPGLTGGCDCGLDGI